MAGGHFSIAPLGDTALLVTCDAKAELARELVRGVVAKCEQQRLPGVTDVVPAFNTLAVHFDPQHVTDALEPRSPIATVRRWLQERCGEVSAIETTLPARPVSIPVVYGGEHGPDLEAVAKTAGMSIDEVVRCHSQAEYSVGAVGFAPGFGYLEGLPQPLRLPRRATPRIHVPAGSVALGGPYTGVYPQASPGGWHVIGRTPLAMFSLENDPPALLAVGDRVRFTPIASADFQSVENSQVENPLVEKNESSSSLFEVVSPGVLTTLQDGGRTGFQSLGVSPAGAMDRDALRLANVLAGAAENAVAIEATLVGPVLRVLSDGVIGVAGATPEGYGGARRVAVRRGETLDLRRLEHGARCYIGVAGGLAVEAVLGSGSTDVRAGIGGQGGRPLLAGDRLAVRDKPTQEDAQCVSAGQWFVPSVGAVKHLRVIRGPATEAFDQASWRLLVTQTYMVSRRSDRTGLRCEGEPLAAASSGDSASKPVVHGVVQVPPDGQPVILGADRQTLGGYPVIACVVSADLPLLGQLKPGDRFHFVEVSETEAESLRQKHEAEFRRTLAGVDLHHSL